MLVPPDPASEAESLGRTGADVGEPTDDGGADSGDPRAVGATPGNGGVEGGDAAIGPSLRPSEGGVAGGLALSS